MSKCRFCVVVALLLAALISGYHGVTEAQTIHNVETTVSFVQVNSDGTVRFKVPTQMSSCTPSGGGDKFHGDIAVGRGGVTTEGLRGMLTLLTSARLSGRTVTVYYQNGVSPAYGCTVSALNLN